MEMIQRDLICPNDWNVNAFDPDQYPKLVESIRSKGLMEPLKVMAAPDRPGHYLLIDGYHRWKAAGELVIEELPCEVWNISSEEAKVRGLQLNYLRGQPVPDRLASLVHDLNRELSLPDLAALLPWTEAQLRDSLELLKLPADLRQRVETQAAAQAAQAPIPVTVVMLPREHQAFEQAMAQARQDLGKGARRGELWAHVCRGYVGHAQTAVTPAGAAAGEPAVDSGSANSELRGLGLDEPQGVVLWELGGHSPWSSVSNHPSGLVYGCRPFVTTDAGAQQPREGEGDRDHLAGAQARRVARRQPATGRTVVHMAVREEEGCWEHLVAEIDRKSEMAGAFGELIASIRFHKGQPQELKVLERKPHY